MLLPFVDGLVTSGTVPARVRPHPRVVRRRVGVGGGARGGRRGLRAPVPVLARGPHAQRRRRRAHARPARDAGVPRRRQRPPGAGHGRDGGAAARPGGAGRAGGDAGQPRRRPVPPRSGHRPAAGGVRRRGRAVRPAGSSARGGHRRHAGAVARPAGELHRRHGGLRAGAFAPPAAWGRRTDRARRQQRRRRRPCRPAGRRLVPVHDRPRRTGRRCPPVGGRRPGRRPRSADVPITVWPGSADPTRELDVEWVRRFVDAGARRLVVRPRVQTRDDLDALPGFVDRYRAEVVDLL